MNTTWNYFNEKTDPLISGLDPELMSMLDMARGKAGVPFMITSGRRTQEENTSLKGAVCDSAHLKGLAVDLSCQDDHALWCMCFGLYVAGFRRIGIYLTHCVDNPSKLIPRHIHVDIDTSKPLEVTWVLKEQN